MIVIVSETSVSFLAKRSRQVNVELASGRPGGALTAWTFIKQEIRISNRRTQIEVVLRCLY